MYPTNQRLFSRDLLESMIMSLCGIMFLAACWLLFLALCAVQFLSLGLVPVLAPVLVTLIIGQVGLLQRAHQFAQRFRRARSVSARPKAVAELVRRPLLAR
jgi:hypothetical protein